MTILGMQFLFRVCTLQVHKMFIIRHKIDSIMKIVLYFETSVNSL